MAQTHDTPPATRLVDADGSVVAELAKSDTTKFDQLGLKRVELIKYKAADGVTELHGLLHFPSNFDPNKEISAAGQRLRRAGHKRRARDIHAAERADRIRLSGTRRSIRAAPAGAAKRFLDAIYMKLGVAEMDDQAAGVKSLWSRPYVDKNRVGIFGTSYGGYASALCLLRHPDVFQAASASSPP